MTKSEHNSSNRCDEPPESPAAWADPVIRVLGRRPKNQMDLGRDQQDALQQKLWDPPQIGITGWRKKSSDG